MATSPIPNLVRDPPRCMMVTGPRGAGKTHWIQQRILALTGATKTRVSFGVLLQEEGRTRMENFTAARPNLVLRKLALPCPCCPGLAGLPLEARAFVEATSMDWLFVEMPMDAAFGLLADFDRELGWPRSLTICLNPAWSRAWRRRALSPFQLQLLTQADNVIESVSASPVPSSLSLYDSS
ncbi:hypothetical protein [Synoicihabitans lomoniglobus]|uniref:Uncharacterized protein n=1 Tax=Synoicihabitans lomoniglobus TaxID=2909285 RepID=A0AAE9ZWY8_9BACT|nr:hypothetical protein [Opitutaceae bacterium LMO-M01]WED64719.1 hypothetical protein PXH66_20440 [Opitutaceae bacterium LMO-M01]